MSPSLSQHTQIMFVFRMNNCESDKVKLWKLIRSSNDELVTLYTDIENSLSEYLALLEACCEDKNDLLQQIIQRLDVLIQNLIDCCEAIKDRLDDIIDIIVDPIPDIYNRWQVQYNEHICFTDDEDNYLDDWLAQFEDHTCDNVPEEDFPYTYRVQYTGHVCEIIIPPPPDEEEWVAIFHAHICETREALPQEIEYEAEFEDHLCIIREPLPSEIEWYVEFEDHACWILDEFDEYWPIFYSVEFNNRVCIQDWECDLDGHLIEVTEDDITIYYEGFWDDYTCVLYEGQDREGELNLDGDGYVEFDADENVTHNAEVIFNGHGNVTFDAEVETFGGCIEYGLLYNWWAASDARNIANTGWRVPSNADMVVLRQYLDPLGSNTSNVAGIPMKAGGYTYWQDSGDPSHEGTNTSGFNGRGAGERPVGGAFSSIGVTLSMWNTNEYSSSNAGVGVLRYDMVRFSAGNWVSNKKSGFCIRLLKASTSLQNGETGTYTGNDGKIYKTICIGTQEWLAENLAETKFRDGSIVPWYGADPVQFFTNAEWDVLTSAGMCAYGNSVSNVGCDFEWPEITTTTTTIP